MLIGASIAAVSWAAPSEVAQHYLETAIGLLEAKHINSDKADWERIKSETSELVADAQTTADTYPAIRHVLTQLGEKHSFLIEPPQQGAATVEAGASSTIPRQPLPQWKLIGENIGLVQLPQLVTFGTGGEAAGKTYSAVLKTALTEMDSPNLCGWIIDLRENGGGNMWPMLQGLDPLLGSSPFGFFTAKGAHATPWARTAMGILPAPEPSTDIPPVFRLEREKAPVAVLIGPNTASSGEMVALALIGRAGVRTFGKPSAGFTTANVPYPLNDGAVLLITETTVRDRTGRDYNGSIMPDSPGNMAEAESAAVEWLNSECQRREEAS